MIQPPGTNHSLPVWVYIYGGRFLFGHASHDYIDPQMFVDSGIVAVTLNYRSGPLGNMLVFATLFHTNIFILILFYLIIIS